MTAKKIINLPSFSIFYIFHFMPKYFNALKKCQYCQPDYMQIIHVFELSITTRLEHQLTSNNNSMRIIINFQIKHFFFLKDISELKKSGNEIWSTLIIITHGSKTLSSE